MAERCEWCEKPAKWVFTVAEREGYQRFCCDDFEHERKTDRLVHLDNDPCIRQVEYVAEPAGEEK